MDVLQDLAGNIFYLLEDIGGSLLGKAEQGLQGSGLESLPVVIQEYWPLVLVLIVLFLLSQLFELPLKLLWNGLIGAATLFLVNLLGSFIGFSLKITLWKALVAGFLGIPGTIAVVLYEILG